MGRDGTSTRYKASDPKDKERCQLPGIRIEPNYITSSPGYSGKLMVVVYDGAPEMTETYTWVKDNENNIAKLYRNVAVNTSN